MNAKASVEIGGHYTRGQTILEKRFVSDVKNADADSNTFDSRNNDPDVNVEIVEDLDMKLVEHLMMIGLTAGPEDDS